MACGYCKCFPRGKVGKNRDQKRLERNVKETVRLAERGGSPAPARTASNVLL